MNKTPSMKVGGGGQDLLGRIPVALKGSPPGWSHQTVKAPPGAGSTSSSPGLLSVTRSRITRIETRRHGCLLPKAILLTKHDKGPPNMVDRSSMPPKSPYPNPTIKTERKTTTSALALRGTPARRRPIKKHLVVLEVVHHDVAGQNRWEFRHSAPSLARHRTRWHHKLCWNSRSDCCLARTDRPVIEPMSRSRQDDRG